MLTYADVCRYGVNKALTEEEMALLCHVCRQHQQDMRAQERERQDDDSLRERWQGKGGREQHSPGTQFTCFTGSKQRWQGERAREQESPSTQFTGTKVAVLVQKGTKKKNTDIATALGFM